MKVATEGELEKCTALFDARIRGYASAESSGGGMTGDDETFSASSSFIGEIASTCATTASTTRARSTPLGKNSGTVGKPSFAMNIFGGEDASRFTSSSRISTPPSNACGTSRRSSAAQTPSYGAHVRI